MRREGGEGRGRGKGMRGKEEKEGRVGVVCGLTYLYSLITSQIRVVHQSRHSEG